MEERLSLIVDFSARVSSEVFVKTRNIDVPAPSVKVSAIRETAADSDDFGAPDSGAVSAFDVADNMNIVPATAVAITIAMMATKSR
jgi:hypothetical protein